LIGRTQ
nr:Chain 5, human coxsackievirus A21 [Coxsackievirus A21]